MMGTFRTHRPTARESGDCALRWRLGSMYVEIAVKRSIKNPNNFGASYTQKLPHY